MGKRGRAACGRDRTWACDIYKAIAYQTDGKRVEVWLNTEFRCRLGEAERIPKTNDLNDFNGLNQWNVSDGFP